MNDSTTAAEPVYIYGSSGNRKHIARPGYFRVASPGPLPLGFCQAVGDGEERPDLPVCKTCERIWRMRNRATSATNDR